MSQPAADMSLQTIRGYLDSHGVVCSEEHGEVSEPFLQMAWRFSPGEGSVFVCLSRGKGGDQRLEIACVTRSKYLGQRDVVLEFINERNRSNPFSRSIDQEGNYWLEYVGFYPDGCPLPEVSFNTLFGGVLLHFEEDYAALEEMPQIEAGRVTLQ